MDFLNLPINLSCRVIGSWINLSSFVNFDTAVRTTKETLAQYSLVNNELILHETVNLTENHILSWLLLREIKVSNCGFDNIADETNLPRYLRLFGSHVRKVGRNL